jgi:FAD/FMN-containing dehydrogenase
VGNIVRIKEGVNRDQDGADHWPECYGQIGVITGFAMRLHIPAVKVYVLGEVAEFDQDEVEAV